MKGGNTISNPFIWFDNRSGNSAETAKHYADLFGWQKNVRPSMDTSVEENVGHLLGCFDAHLSVTGCVSYILQLEII